jgi:hypothetical protein
MHPTIEAFCRVGGVGACQSHFFNRIQRELRDHVQPLLDERDRLALELEALKRDYETLKAQMSEAKAARKRPAVQEVAQ